MVPSVLTVTEASAILKCKRTKVFALLAQGVLVRAPRFGRETTVYADSVERALLPPVKRGRKCRAPVFTPARLEDIEVYR